MSDALPLNRATDQLPFVYATKWKQPVRELLLAPEGFGTSHVLAEALHLIPSDWRGSLLPLCLIDEDSIAVVAVDAAIPGTREGHVYRLHLSKVPPRLQLRLLDIDPLIYVASLDEELAARPVGLRRVLDQIGPAYELSHLRKEKRPRDFVVRPVRIACQNVIVALGAIAHDSSFDGLTVPAWQTCELPHVATHEGNRALAALTLCDAFQSGGTMEIRFDRKARIVHKGRPLDLDGHPEKAVPASLRRFGRAVGVSLGSDDPATISPREARDLFLAITPMPDGLRGRVSDAVHNRGIAPERICFLLLSQVWREIEMDYILATTGRTTSILSGGAQWTDRFARQAEAEICRGAVTTGMLFRRLNATDNATGGCGVVRVVEDRTKGISWELRPEVGAVTLTGLDPSEPVPWTFLAAGVQTLTVFPRSAISAEIVREIVEADVPGDSAILTPADTELKGEVPSQIRVLRCPDRLADIDKSVEDRLLKSRISRG
ncbi:hypothetical protein [Rhodococcus sp. KRD162]|uniref:hypothetical protein n=1 Tax=Rhodococcus sp. KRD162 TaxID=2729725 RepID=UPI0019D2C559|nr:hypothetical protein [Rhodococcus sp. KRD162]